MFCPSCGTILEIPSDVLEDEILSCQSCGTELQAYIYRGVLTVTEAQIEGEDWGE